MTRDKDKRRISADKGKGEQLEIKVKENSQR